MTLAHGPSNSPALPPLCCWKTTHLCRAGAELGCGYLPNIVLPAPFVLVLTGPVSCPHKPLLLKCHCHTMPGMPSLLESLYTIFPQRSQLLLSLQHSSSSMARKPSSSCSSSFSAKRSPQRTHRNNRLPRGQGTAPPQLAQGWNGHISPLGGTLGAHVVGT